MKLLLTNTDDPNRWHGACDIDGDIYQVIIWPGSMTSDWKASLQPALFVELTPGGQLETAINEAKVSLDRGWPRCETSNADDASHHQPNQQISQDVMDAILAVLSKGA